MRRREFIALVGRAATTSPTLWPLAAFAQQPERLPLVGFLHIGAADMFVPIVSAFRNALTAAGFVEGKSVAIEFRWAEGRYERLPDLATELVSLRPVLIVAGGGQPTALAAKAATLTIPILFIGGDVTDSGLVASLARPGGNLTGIDLPGGLLEAKRLQLLLELVPKAVTIAMLIDPNSIIADKVAAEFLRIVRASGRLELVYWASSDSDIERSFAGMIEQRADALLVASTPYYNSRRNQIVALAARAGIPASYEFREFVAVGGLMSYGTSLLGVYSQIGRLAVAILKGAKPADLPVEQPTRF